MRRRHDCKFGGRGQHSFQQRACRGFSLVDLLVTLVVIAVLVGLLFPSLSGVRAVVDRVVCASGLHQQSLALAMFTDDNKGMLPYTMHPRNNAFKTTVIYFTDPRHTEIDGLGHLYPTYLDAPDIFYCPGYTGVDDTIENDRQAWEGNEQDEVSINYQYRGGQRYRPRGAREVEFQYRLDLISPRFKLIADALGNSEEFNHDSGANVVSVDLSVAWFEDADRSLRAALPDSRSNANDKHNRVLDAWEILDRDRPEGE